MTPRLNPSEPSPRVTMDLDALVRLVLRAALIPASDTAADGAGYTVDMSPAGEVIVGFEDPRDRLYALIGLRHVCVALGELLTHVPFLTACGVLEENCIHLRLAEALPAPPPDLTVVPLRRTS